MPTSMVPDVGSPGSMMPQTPRGGRVHGSAGARKSKPEGALRPSVQARRNPGSGDDAKGVALIERFETPGRNSCMYTHTHTHGHVVILSLPHEIPDEGFLAPDAKKWSPWLLTNDLWFDALSDDDLEVHPCHGNPTNESISHAISNPSMTYTVSRLWCLPNVRLNVSFI